MSENSSVELMFSTKPTLNKASLDGGTDENTGGGDGGGRVEDATIFIRSVKNGQTQEWVHQRDSTGGTVWRENTRGKTWWYGHVRRKFDWYIRRRMLRMELPGKRKRGRPKRGFMDVVKDDMAEVEVTEEDTEDRNNWRWKIRCGVSFERHRYTHRNTV